MGNDFWSGTRASRVVATPSLPRNPSVHGSHRSAGRDAALKPERCEKSAGTRKISRISEDNEYDDSNGCHTEVDWDVFTRQMDLTTPTEHHGASQQAPEVRTPSVKFADASVVTFRHRVLRTRHTVPHPHPPGESCRRRKYRRRTGDRWQGAKEHLMTTEAST